MEVVTPKRGPMKKSTFDMLREWAKLEDAELVRIFSKRNGKTLSDIVQDLGTADHKAYPIDRDSFPGLVREMADLLKNGSRQLGDVILRASRYEAEGKMKRAARLYRDFITSCPSDFYKVKAQHELDRLLSPKSPVAHKATKADIAQLNRLLRQVRNLLGQCATRIADHRLNTGDNLQRVCEADREVCEIQADIQKIDNISEPK